ncbi:MAG: hypothetical protein JNJ57_14040 [Saprospiraceae bacterium]|nr:hypothetical protein [Saprospiraceae bacterium]
MTTRLNLTVALLTLALSVSAQSPGRTFTKSFNTDNRGTIILDLPGAIDLKVWDNPSIRFEISVSLPSGNGSMLNELANIGRYDLVSKSENDAITITAPNLQKQLKVKGEPLKEELTFMVFVPKNLKIELPNATAQASFKK